MMLHEIAPYRMHIEYEKRAVAPTDFVVVLQKDSILVATGEQTKLPTVTELAVEGVDLQYLVRIDDAIFRMYPKEPETVPSGYEFLPMRELRTRKPMWCSYGALLAARIAIFYQFHQFCGICGQRMKPSETERAMICTGCGATVYPPIGPAVIVLIRDGNRAVLTKYQATHSSYKRYALVAGYVETGETPEETVIREVREEVGLHVKNIRYYKSQPWPLSGTLLLGYVCDLDGEDTIVREEGELSVAEWISREDIPNRADDVSLTSEMMERFRTGLL